MMKRSLFFVFLTMLFSSCEKGDLTSTPSELEGVWVFKGYQLGETLNEGPGCEKEIETVTLEFTRKGGGFEVFGQSFINTYFSVAEVSYNLGIKSGTLKFNGIGTTKKGGPQDLMECETVYYQGLEHSSKIKIESSRLYLERVPLPIESRIWPVMVFEKKKV